MAELENYKKFFEYIRKAEEASLSKTKGREASQNYVGVYKSIS